MRPWDDSRQCFLYNKEVADRHGEWTHLGRYNQAAHECFVIVA